MPVICTVLSSTMYTRTSGPSSGRSSAGRGCPCRVAVTLALLSPFSPICPCSQSSCLRYPWVESPTGLISTSWRQRLASGVDISDFWGCEDAIAHICTLRLLLRIISSWALGWLCRKNTHGHVHTYTKSVLNPSAPWYQPKRLKTMSTGQKKGDFSPQLSSWERAAWRLRKTVTYYKHDKETNFWVVCPFCHYFTLLYIISSAQQACILPFSYNNSSSFLLPDLVSVLDMVEKKRLCFKLPIENESTNAE